MAVLAVVAVRAAAVMVAKAAVKVVASNIMDGPLVLKQRNML